MICRVYIVLIRLMIIHNAYTCGPTSLIQYTRIDSFVMINTSDLYDLYVNRWAACWGIHCVTSFHMITHKLLTEMPFCDVAENEISTHYKTADTDIQHCMQYITNISHSLLTGDVNAHSTLWHSDHITLNTNTPTRVPSTTLQQTSSPDITTVSNTLYNRTSWTPQHALSSDHLSIIATINIQHDYRLQQDRQTFTNYKKAD